MTYPIVLAHGICRFDVFLNDCFKIDNSNNQRLDMLHYFKGVRSMLRSKGYEVYHSSVSWAARVDTRADELKRNIQEILRKAGRGKVNIIAHSMGGLDARHMMFQYRNSDPIHKHVASLSTISTPHSGSPFADWGLRNLPKFIPMARSFGLDLEGVVDLTVASCRKFNENPEARDFEEKCVEDEGIQFRTYAGSQHFKGVFGLLKMPFCIIEKEEGKNDGLVSVQSAKWNEKYFEDDPALKEADHLNELGWWDPDQIFIPESGKHLLARIHGFYARLAAKLP